MRSVSVFTLLLLFLTLSCRPTPKVEPEPKQYSVPAGVEPFVETFRKMAQQRGLSIPTDNLIIVFGTPQAQDVCGQCFRQAGQTPRITLSANAFCWQNANAEEREALVFHELGHCWLNRDHRADRFPNGVYASLMNPDDVDVYAVCRYPINDDACDKRPRRSYYHDELFDPATPAPAWSR